MNFSAGQFSYGRQIPISQDCGDIAHCARYGYNYDEKIPLRLKFWKNSYVYFLALNNLLMGAKLLCRKIAEMQRAECAMAMYDYEEKMPFR